MLDREVRHGRVHVRAGDHVSPVIVWTKPSCVQCRLVKHRLEVAGVPFTEMDLTAPESAKDLEHFRRLGYTSAPITEFEGIAVPGLMPSELDRIIGAWKAIATREEAGR
jgi:glutaredoxin-like protein NrdH